MKLKILFTATAITITVLSYNKLMAGYGSSQDKPISQMTGPTLNDAQVTRVLEVTDEGEVELAKLALEKSQNTKVKTFARAMIDKHNHHRELSMALDEKYAMKPAESEKSKEMMKARDKAILKLRKLSGKKFDTAYISNQISMHEKVLYDLDVSLIPSAKNEELKTMLMHTKPEVSEHLNEARKVKQSL